MQNSKFLSIAIDGPAGAGKTTVAKELSKKLNILYLNTGAMYRAVGLEAYNQKLDLKDEKKVLAFLNSVQVDVEYVNGLQRTIINNKDVTDLISTEIVSDMASKISSLQPVREEMVTIQRTLAKKQSIIIDGRDITTVVLKETNNKFYLDATIEERATRRYKEYVSKGKKAFYKEILEDIKARDHRDTTREHSPLRLAPDAMHIDSTNLTIEQVVDVITKNLK